jgi:hypothetical protein
MTIVPPQPGLVELGSDQHLPAIFDLYLGMLPRRHGHRPKAQASDWRLVLVRVPIR